jgi:hypothetical protein
LQRLAHLTLAIWVEQVNPFTRFTSRNGLDEAEFEQIKGDRDEREGKRQDMVWREVVMV